MKLLILGSTILAADAVETADAFQAHDIIYPKSVIAGYELHDVDAPADFTVAVYEWVNGALQAKPAPVVVKTREELKAERQAKVDAIKVTTQAGHTFDGDEVSQERMSRAIIALNAASALGLGSTVNWVLADNTVIQASVAELTEALVLAGQAQAAIWVI